MQREIQGIVVGLEGVRLCQSYDRSRQWTSLFCIIHMTVAGDWQPGCYLCLVFNLQSKIKRQRIRRSNIASKWQTKTPPENVLLYWRDYTYWPFISPIYRWKNESTCCLNFSAAPDTSIQTESTHLHKTEILLFQNVITKETLSLQYRSNCVIRNPGLNVAFVCWGETGSSR